MNQQSEHDRFALPRGYRANLERPFGGGAGYWTAERLRASAFFQYHVYATCVHLVRKHSLQNVLDVGCGPGTKIRDLIVSVCPDITLMDRAELATVVQQTVSAAHFVPVDLEEADEDLGRRFDLVICSDVIEHLVNPDPCLDLIKRHLSPDGFAVISTPERKALRGFGCMYSPKPDNVREWSAVECRHYVETRGFRLVRHLLYPPGRVSRAELCLSRLLPWWIGRSRWRSCQVLICRHSTAPVCGE